MPAIECVDAPRLAVVAEGADLLQDVLAVVENLAMHVEGHCVPRAVHRRGDDGIRRIVAVLQADRLKLLRIDRRNVLGRDRADESRQVIGGDIRPLSNHDPPIPRNLGRSS
jgi:hypothetical protein